MTPNADPVFASPDAKARSESAYDAALAAWPVPYQPLMVNTAFGMTHVIVSGPEQAVAVVLLHGQDSAGTSWLYNIRELSEGFHAYAIDTVGDVGRSEPTRLPMSRSDYSKWLIDVFDGLGIRSANLVGHSYGGFLAVNFAIDHPDRVGRIVLLAPGIPNLGHPTWKWAWYGLPMMQWPSSSTVKRFIKGASARGYSNIDQVQQQMIASIPGMRKPGFMRPVFTNAELSRCQFPVLLLVGDREIMYEPHHAMQTARALFPDLESMLVGGAGHMLNSDQPVTVDREIQRFFSGEPRGR